MNNIKYDNKVYIISTQNVMIDAWHLTVVASLVILSLNLLSGKNQQKKEMAIINCNLKEQ